MTGKENNRESFIKRLQQEKKWLQGEIKALQKSTERKVNKMNFRINLIKKYLEMEFPQDEIKMSYQKEFQDKPARKPPVKYSVRDGILNCLREHPSGLKKGQIVEWLREKHGESNEGSVSTTLQHLKKTTPRKVENEDGNWLLVTSQTIRDALE